MPSGRSVFFLPFLRNGLILCLPACSLHCLSPRWRFFFWFVLFCLLHFPLSAHPECSADTRCPTDRPGRCIHSVAIMKRPFASYYLSLHFVLVRVEGAQRCDDDDDGAFPMHRANAKRARTDENQMASSFVHFRDEVIWHNSPALLVGVSKQKGRTVRSLEGHKTKCGIVSPCD